MKKFYVILAILIIAATLLSACTVSTVHSTSAADSTAAAEHDKEEVSVVTVSDPTDETRIATGDFTISDEDGSSLEPTGNAYRITSAGTYTLKGNLEDGTVVIEAGENDEVKLVLDNATVSCSYSAPINALSASKVDVEAAEGSYNTVKDLRTGNAEEAETSEENYDGAIYAACDLKLSGSGTLVVESSYDNGVKSKDDLTVKSITLKVTAVGNALKGNDSVEIKSGNVILVSTSADAIKTSNTDVSSKGNQKGSIVISGGHVDVYAACDGISAAYNAEISGDDTVLNVFTSDYSESSGSVASSTELYLIVPSSLYSTANDYYAYFYSGDSEGTWVKCEFETMVSSGRNASYYGLLVKAPSGATGVKFAVMNSGATPGESSASAITDGETINSSMNGYLIESVSGNEISGDWVQLTRGNGSGNSNKTAYSSKGIKAENSVVISGGTISVYCKDDAIHANADATLENGEKALGSVEISGGDITITAADDGIHADGKLTISGGYVNIVKSHEGLEGNVVTVAGGTVYVYADDDGVNAVKGSSSVLVNVTGGYLDVTTPSGDTDGIDSNGNITVSGGTIVVRCGSAMGGMAGSIDADGSISVTGGTVIALGGICETPENGSVCTYISSGTSFAAGDYVLSDSNGNEIVAFTLPASYSSCWISSDRFELGGGYKLTNSGTEVLSWTQSSATVGSSGNSNPGGGRPGGGGPGGR